MDTRRQIGKEYPSMRFRYISNQLAPETTSDNHFPFTYLTFKGNLEEFEALLDSWNKANKDNPLTYQIQDKEHSILSIDYRFCADSHQVAHEFAVVYSLKF